MGFFDNIGANFKIYGSEDTLHDPEIKGKIRVGFNADGEPVFINFVTRREEETWRACCLCAAQAYCDMSYAARRSTGCDLPFCGHKIYFEKI